MTSWGCESRKIANCLPWPLSDACHVPGFAPSPSDGLAVYFSHSTFRTHTLRPLKAPTGMLPSLSLPGPSESPSFHSWLFCSSCPSRFSEDPAFSKSKPFLQGHRQYDSFLLSNKLHPKEVTIGASTFPSRWKIRFYFYYIILMIPPEYKDRSNI